MMRFALLSLALGCAPVQAQEALRPYEVVGDAIPKSLTGEPGDPERGRAIVVKRESTCLLCHSGPFPEQRFQGDLSPNLKGAPARAGRRASCGCGWLTPPASIRLPSCRRITGSTA